MKKYKRSSLEEIRKRNAEAYKGGIEHREEAKRILKKYYGK